MPREGSELKLTDWLKWRKYCGRLHLDVYYSRVHSSSLFPKTSLVPFGNHRLFHYIRGANSQCPFRRLSTGASVCKHACGSASGFMSVSKQEKKKKERKKWIDCAYWAHRKNLVSLFQSSNQRQGLFLIQYNFKSTVKCIRAKNYIFFSFSVISVRIYQLYFILTV